MFLTSRRPICDSQCSLMMMGCSGQLVWLGGESLCAQFHAQNANGSLITHGTGSCLQVLGLCKHAGHSCNSR